MITAQSRLPRFFISIFASSLALLFLGGCATPPPVFNVSALTPYRNLAVMPVITNEKLFVQYRRWYRTGGINLAGMLIDEGYAARVNRINSEFNEKIGKNMKHALEERLYTLVKNGLTTRQVKFSVIEIAESDVMLHLTYRQMLPEQRTRLVSALRAKCPTCDAALLIDPSFGYAGNGKNALFASANATVLLVSLPDGEVRGRSTLSYFDETSKYDYFADSDVVKDAVRAATFIPPTVEPLAALILGVSGGR